MIDCFRYAPKEQRSSAAYAGQEIKERALLDLAIDGVITVTHSPDPLVLDIALKSDLASDISFETAELGEVTLTVGGGDFQNIGEKRLFTGVVANRMDLSRVTAEIHPDRTGWLYRRQ